MENLPVSCDFETAMRIPGYPSMYLFCVHPVNSTAYVFDGSMNRFILIDLSGLNDSVEMERVSFLTASVGSFCGLHCIEYDSKTFILALMVKEHINSVWLVLYELKIEERIAIVKKEHYIALREDYLLKMKLLVNDENGDLYYVASTDDKESQKFTFSVTKLIIDATLNVSHNILIEHRIIERSCLQLSFIHNKYIGFFVNVDYVAFRQTVLISLEENTRNLEQYCVIAPDMMIPDVNSQFISNDTSSSPSFQSSASGLLYCYIFNNEKRKGELWAVDFKSKKWHKSFEFVSHVIKPVSQLVLRRDGRLFLHGNCADEDCGEKAHVYHFGVSLLGEKYFPTIEQLEAMMSKSKTQIYIGPKGSGKSLMLLLKAIDAFRSDPDSDKIKIVISSNEQRDEFCNKLSSIFGKSFQSNVLLLSENNYEEEQFADCDIFVDGLSSTSFSFEQKCFLLNRPKRTIVILDEDCVFQYGFDHPRTENVSWHRFKPIMKDSDSHVGSPVALLSRHDYNEQPVTKKQETEKLSTNNNKKNFTHNISEFNEHKGEIQMELYAKQCLESMDYLYKEWWSPSTEKETICIPACLDVCKNKCSIPTGSDEKGHFIGQKAENDFLIAFQKLKIGGILVSGFDLLKFMQAKKYFEKVFKKSAIELFETDSIFIHPCIGVFIFETKAISNSNKKNNKSSLRKTIKEAEAQLNRIKDELPKVFKKICNVQCSMDIHSAICLPNADMSEHNNDSNYPIFDNSALRDTQELKDYILSKMNDTLCDEKNIEYLKIFAAAIAGYRSMDFLSAGHNALAVQKMINEIGKELEKKKRNKLDLHFLPEKKPDLREGEHDIFLTNYQLAIVECQDRHQIISGPPGTGKTLIILRKALLASMTKKNGNIHIIAPTNELLFKFQKFFEMHREKVARFPSFHYWLDSYSEDDDVFADEISLKHSKIKKLNERLKQSGCGITVIGITGLFNPLEVQNVEDFLLKQNLTGFTHFSMDTVIRSSKEIFDEWKEHFNGNSNSNNPICIGHSIFGSVVQKVILKSSVEILNRIKEIIHGLFEINANSSTTEKISLKNLCVITDYSETCSLIKSFLASSHIPCGSIEEQNIEQNIAAISTFDCTVSHEWPVVIVVSVIDTTFRHQFSLLAISRCIARLVIIERNFEDVTIKIDQCTEQLRFSSEPSMLTFSSFRDAIGKAEKQIGETNNFIINHYVTYQTIRWNICFAELKKLKVFKNCNSLFECWQIFADDLILCRSFFQEVENANRFRPILINNKKMDRIPEKPSSFFLRITERLTKEEQEKAWKTLKQIEKNLYDIVISEESGSSHRNANDMDEVKDILDEVNKKMASDAWKFLCNTFQYLMD